MSRALLPKERLDILQRADLERKWHALDDKRVCSVCDRIFTGRQVEMEHDARGGFHLHCPTPGCPSTVRHWLLFEVSFARREPGAVRDAALLDWFAGKCRAL